MLRWLKGGLPVAMCSAMVPNDHMSAAGLPHVLLLVLALVLVLVPAVLVLQDSAPDIPVHV